MAEKKQTPNTDTKKERTRTNAPARRGRPAKAKPVEEKKNVTVEEVKNVEPAKTEVVENNAEVVSQGNTEAVANTRPVNRGYWFTVGGYDKTLYMIISGMFLLLTIICDALYLSAVIGSFGKSDEQLLMFTTLFAFFYIPSILTSIISVIFGVLSLRSSLKWVRIVSIVFVSIIGVLIATTMILSFVILF